MSSSDDSETKEWENEQMLRGTQSRARQQQPQQSNPRARFPQSAASAAPQQPVPHQNPDVIDATRAKNHVTCDIGLVEAEIEVTRRKIGSTTKEISYADKRIEAMKRQIEKLEESNPFFEELKNLKDPGEVLTLLEKNKQLITRLPPDQKEMVDLLKGRMKDSEVPMSVDND